MLARCAFLLLFFSGFSEASSWSVCLTGLLRSTLNERLAENVRQRLFQSLPSATRVDVFGAFDAEAASRSAELYRHWPELTNSTVFLSTPAFTGNSRLRNGERFYQQWAKVDACFQLVQAAEVRRGERYDFFLRARSDLYFYYPVSNWLTANRSVVQTGAGLGCTPTDHFGSMPRHYAPMYAAAGEVTFDPEATPQNMGIAGAKVMCHCGANPDDGMHPECLIAGWLALRGVPVSNVCDHEYELWRHTHENDGLLTDFWNTPLNSSLETHEGTACSRSAL